MIDSLAGSIYCARISLGSFAD